MISTVGTVCCNENVQFICIGILWNVNVNAYGFIFYFMNETGIRFIHSQ